MSDGELPELLTLLPCGRNDNTAYAPSTALRRSPRKQNATLTKAKFEILEDAPQLSASSQQRMSPQKQQSPVRAALKTTQPKSRRIAFDDVPSLAVTSQKAPQRSLVEPAIGPQDEDASEDDLASLLRPMSLTTRKAKPVKSRYESKEQPTTTAERSSANLTSKMSRITQTAKKQSVTSRRSGPSEATVAQKSNPYVLKEARCEDLNESSGAEEEDEDTDLSGFIVPDDADVSFHGSSEEVSSGEDERSRRRKNSKRNEPILGRRLVRGRRPRISDNEDGLTLSNAMDAMNIGRRTLDKQKDTARTKTIEIIDLTSSPVSAETSGHDTAVIPDDTDEVDDSFVKPVSTLFSRFDSIPKLEHKGMMDLQILPLTSDPLPSGRQRPAKKVVVERPSTPPTTPPRSPSKTKLKSPTKLLSPSKKLDSEAPRSPHRQSMDSFWDHNAVNEWHDTYSPKKAPLLSPCKNPLAKYNMLIPEDLEDLEDSFPNTSNDSSQDPFDESSGSLPSPTTSPSKSRSPAKVSAIKAEQTRLREEKRMKLAAKKAFDASKEKIAINLLVALDKHVTNSKISNVSASTGGIQVIWSKTLRSTAGRANWKRTVNKLSGSSVKGNLDDSQSIEKQPAIVVQHYASIELAEKIIDRPERLVNTLAHEFCHLANFMVSGIRDQPHGESFKRWGARVTSWLKSPAAKEADGWREEWMLAEVTTKHSYVIETKYLWVCTGRPAAKQKQSLAMKMLNIENEDEEGCGAEYGRHSKSIDVDKQRCGRCKGFLVQVRPVPRASSPRKSPVKRTGLRVGKQESSDLDRLEGLLKTVDLND